MSQTLTPLIHPMLDQSRMSNGFALEGITEEKVGLRLNPNANSVGFIYRHIGETLHLFTTFYGLPTEVENTTMGLQDVGQGEDITLSKTLIESGMKKLYDLAMSKDDEYWLEEIDTPFFGKVSRFRLLCHILYHNSHHSGQISLTLSRGN